MHCIFELSQFRQHEKKVLLIQRLQREAFFSLQ